MFFRKRTTVAEFLDRVIGRLLSADRTFIYEDFFREYAELKAGSGVREGTGSRASDRSSEERDLFLNRFIGTLLWLIKYRVLSNMFNSQRRQAYLDLNFDVTLPGIVDTYFNLYDTDLIKAAYEDVDIGCKKAYTGEMLKGDKPRFLVSPIWARNPDPHPFRVAARLFIESSGGGVPENRGDGSDAGPLIDALEERFNAMTDSAAEAARKVNLI